METRDVDAWSIDGIMTTVEKNNIMRLRSMKFHPQKMFFFWKQTLTVALHQTKRLEHRFSFRMTL